MCSQIDGLVQERRKSSELAMELRPFCTNSSKCDSTPRLHGQDMECLLWHLFSENFSCFKEVVYLHFPRNTQRVNDNGCFAGQIGCGVSCNLTIYGCNVVSMKSWNWYKGKQRDVIVCYNTDKLMIAQMERLKHYWSAWDQTAADTVFYGRIPE